MYDARLETIINDMANETTDLYKRYSNGEISIDFVVANFPKCNLELGRVLLNYQKCKKEFVDSIERKLNGN